MNKFLKKLLLCNSSLIPVFLFLSFASNAQPPNDNPTGATSLLHANNTVITGNTTGATTSDVGVPPGLTRANSVWYKFTATSTVVIMLVVKLSANDPAVRLFNDDFSFNVSRIRGANTYSRLMYNNLTVGQNYYIMVDNNPGQPGAFRLTI
mgnify:CR=1 FL=1